MPRQVGSAGKRDKRVTLALSRAEVALLDAERGSLSRSEYLRLVWLNAPKGLVPTRGSRTT